MGTQGSGRKRAPLKDRFSAEDEALSSIAREVSSDTKRILFILSCHQFFVPWFLLASLCFCPSPYLANVEKMFSPSKVRCGSSYFQSTMNSWLTGPSAFLF